MKVMPFFPKFANWRAGLGPKWPAICGMVSLIFYVATVEKTILYNNLTLATNLAAPGQLIPFIVGITVFIDGIFTSIRKGRRRGEPDAMDQWPNFKAIPRDCLEFIQPPKSGGLFSAV